MSGPYHIHNSRCPDCGANINGADPIGGGRGPQTGDIAICFYCHHIAAYGDNMQLRNLNDQEIVDVAGDPEIVLAMKMLGASLPHPRAGRS